MWVIKGHNRSLFEISFGHVGTREIREESSLILCDTWMNEEYTDMCMTCEYLWGAWTCIMNLKEDN